MNGENFPSAFQRLPNQFISRSRQQSFRVELQCNLVNGFAPAERLGDHQALIFGPIEICSTRGFLGWAGGFVQQALDMVTQSPSIGWLQIVAISSQHL